MLIFFFRSVFVYVILAVLSERFSELRKFVALPNFFRERFLLQTYPCNSCTTEAEDCLRIVYGQKFCFQLQIRPLNVLLKI